MVVFRPERTAIIFYDIATRADPFFTQARQPFIDGGCEIGIGIRAARIVEADRRFDIRFFQSNFAERNTKVAVLDIDLLRARIGPVEITTFRIFGIADLLLCKLRRPGWLGWDGAFVHPFQFPTPA